MDHGEHGASVARRSSVLGGLPPAEQEAIIDGIRHHNARTVPDDLPPASLPWIGLIRDADKLDVFHVALDALQRDGFRDLPEMLPHLTLERSVSPETIEDVRSRRNCSLNQLSTLGDFLVMQLSWIYDINTLPALQRIRERRIVAQIMSWLPVFPQDRK